MTSKRMRGPIQALSGALLVTVACSVQDLKFAPDSEFEMSEGGSDTGAAAGTKSDAGNGPVTTGGKTNNGGSVSGGTTSTAGHAGSDSGGMATQAGMGGMGVGGMGTTMCPVVRSTKNQPLIDDFEDGNAGLPMPLMGGRAGGWYILTDNTVGATIMPPADPTKPPNPDRPGYDAAASGMAGYALHIAGGNFRGWGAEIGTNFLFIPELGKPCPYIIEGFQGIRFFIHGQVADQVVRFGLATQETVNTDSGGFCDPTKQVCYDTFSFEINPVPTMWTQVSVPFDKLRQLQGGMMNLNLSHVIGIEFAVHGAQSATGMKCPDMQCAFDVWVDQIELY